MGYNERNRMLSDEDYEGIGYDFPGDDFEDDDSEDLWGYITEVEERVDHLKEITVSSVNKSDRLGKALMISVGVNIITATAVVALCCSSPKKFYDALLRREG